MLQMTFSEHCFWLMSFERRIAGLCRKECIWKKYSLIIGTDTFPIFKVLSLELKSTLFCSLSGRNVLLGL